MAMGVNSRAASSRFAPRLLLRLLPRLLLVYAFGVSRTAGTDRTGRRTLSSRAGTGDEGSQPRRPPAARWPAPAGALPVYWFGQNAKAFDTDEYLSNVTSKFDLAIYGWQHAAATAPANKQEAQKLSQQCAQLKAKSNHTRCAVYRQGWIAMSNYDEEMAALDLAGSNTSGWFIFDDSGQHWGHCTNGDKKNPCTGIQGLFWNFANTSAAQYYQEKVIAPIVDDPNVDAVFFDDMPGVCCNSEHVLPSHYSSAAAKKMCDATLANFNRVAKILNDGGKLPIFSMFQKQAQPCRYTRSEIIDKLGSNVSFSRFANTIVDHGNAKGFGESCSVAIMDALGEGAAGLGFMQWEDLREAGSLGPTRTLLNMSEAVFLLVRDPNSYSFFGSSTGWGEASWSWEPSYDWLKTIGKPLGNARQTGTTGQWLREYEHATVRVLCPPPGSGGDATGSIILKVDDEDLDAKLARAAKNERGTHKW